MKRDRFNLPILINVVLILSLLILNSCNQKSDHQPNNRFHIKDNVSDSLQYTKVRFQTQWLHQAQFAGFYVAHDKGFYKNYGIDVDIIMGGPDNPSPEALQKSNADFVSMFLTSALREVDRGNQIINTAQLSQKSSLLLVAKKSSGIRNIQDLNGKRIGLWVSDFREPSITFLNKNNIIADLIPISWTTNVLSQNVVDVMNMMLYNEYDIFVNNGYDPQELTVFPLAEYGVNIPEDGIYCSRQYYLNHKNLCEDFAEATLDGWIYALNHEEETLSLVLSYLKQAHLPTNIPHQRWMLQKVREAVLFKQEQYGKLTEGDYISAIEMMKGNGVINNFLPYKDFIGYAATHKD